MRSFLALLSLAACGDNSGSTTPDSPAPDAPSLPRIEVHVDFQDHTPAENIDVVFHDAEGEPIGVAKTNAQGVVITEDATVAMVTVLTNEGSREISTKVGVQLGDVPWFTLGFGGGPATPPDPLNGLLDLTLPANPPGGADSFEYDFMCESVTTASTAFQHTLLNDCRRAGENLIDVAVIARNGGTEVGFTTMTGVQLAASGATALTFPGGWRTDFATFTVNYANAPAGATSVGTQFQARISGNFYFPANFQVFPVDQGDTASRAVTYVNGFATAIGHGAEIRYGAAQPRASAFLARGIAPVGEETIDLTATLLPPITSVAITGGDTVRPTVAWTQVGGHEMAATGFTFFDWPGGSWSVQLPPDDRSSNQVPALPEDFAAFRPPTDGTLGTPFVVYQRNSYAPTYHDALELHEPFRGEIYEELDTRFPGS